MAVYASQAPGPPPQVIIFQYNPEQMSRSLAVRAAPRDPGNVGSAREDVLRVLGPPVETINLSVELDAADQLAELTRIRTPSRTACIRRLRPGDAAVSDDRKDAEDARSGAGRSGSGSARRYSSGAAGVGKVARRAGLLTEFFITEQAFDPNLNPLQAKVDLGLRILTYMELKQGTVGYMAFLAYQRQKRDAGRESISRWATPAASWDCCRCEIKRGLMFFKGSRYEKWARTRSPTLLGV